MNFNLKNRPRGFTQDQPNPFDKQFKVLKNDYEAWFEGFEAEIRQKVIDYLDEESIGGDIIAEVYKEILGE